MILIFSFSSPFEEHWINSTSASSASEPVPMLVCITRENQMILWISTIANLWYPNSEVTTTSWQSPCIFLIWPISHSPQQLFQPFFISLNPQLHQGPSYSISYSYCVQYFQTNVYPTQTYPHTHTNIHVSEFECILIYIQA